MGDRKSSFSFRFWSSGTRQQPATQTAVAPSTTINSTPPAAPRAESRSFNRSTTRTTNATSGSPRKAENKTPDRQSTSSTTNPTPIASPTTGKKTPAGQLTSNTINSTTSTTPRTFEKKIPDGRTTPPKAENKTLDSQNGSNPTSTTSPTIENNILDGQSNSNTTNLTSKAPPTSEKKTIDSQPTNPANNPPQPTTPSMKQGQVANKQNTIVPAQVTPTSTEVQRSKTTDTTFTNPTKEPKSSSQSLSSARSPSSSQPVAPSRRTRSPLQLSSPSSATPQARSTPLSPSHVASQTQRTPQPRSTNHVGSRTLKHTSSSSPSKESRPTTQEMSTSHEVPTSGYQHEPQLKPDGANDYDDQTMDGTSSKHNEVEVMPSKSSKLGTTTTQNIDSSTVNGQREANIELNMLEETKDVKEVVQATNTKANEEANKEVTPKSASEAQIMEKALPLPNAKPTSTTPQTKKRSTIPNNHNKSVPPLGEHVTSHKDVRDDISSFVNRMGIGDLKSILYDKPVSIITVAGENRGASMQMGSNSSRTEGPVHIHRSYKVNPDESVEAATDGEGSSKGKKSEDANDQQPEAYVNNNAQGINNSIVLNSSVAERNPGVHMVVSHLPKVPIQSTDRASSLGIGKSEKNMTRIDKLTYEPTVRRRCLRGLFLETSDSDPENPIKPRRHGCRLSCQQKDKENDRDDI